MAAHYPWRFVSPPASPARAVAGVFAAAAVAAYGAIVLGEYEMARGWTPLYAGALYGLVVAEVLLVAGRSPTTAAASAAGFVAYGGMTYAVVLSTSRDLDFVEVEAWIGVVIAAAVAWWWVRSAVRLGRHSRREP
jgi:hypothetical protein